MQAAATTIGNQLNTQLSKGVRPYDQSMVPSLSGQTTTGVNSLANNPNNSLFSGAMGSTIGDFGDIASGKRFGTDDPGYAALRAKAGDDTLRDVNSMFTTSGRFGSGSHVDTATEALGNVNAGMDYQNFQNDQQRQMQAASMLPGLYQGSQLPGQAQLQAGQTMDAYNSAKAQDDARRFDATQNAGWNTVQRGGSIFAGTAPVSGTTTTESQPWWKVGTGLAATAFGMA
ncbi:MAG TPA: hypothetical protein VF982_00285 [Anaerolineales bacterium]